MLQNISVRFDPVEDRLVLRFTEGDAAAAVEHWLHVTRRVYAVWRKDLQAMVDRSAALPERMDRGAKAVVAAAHHRAMASQVKLRAEPAPAPRPETPEIRPWLVTAVECGRRKKDERWVLKFMLRERAPLTLVLSDSTLHGLIGAIARRVKVARWEFTALPLDKASSSPSGPPPALH
ncbi:hypothetical protein [Aquabacterium sp.]|uniref:hypothetical protein n=1 Tax=Aquabacterium sp. TaxID=1872578 RepID=UPI002BC20AB8|nr:hypothetical protein [Aquabacterium sp.]HSW05885.1 hypothetical protein [Aquabacterium sp.]